MSLPIRIDLGDVVEEFQLNLFEADLLGTAIIDRVVQEYVIKWNKLIDTELKQSREEYRKAIYIERPSGLEVIFGLSARASKLALMVEEGAPPFDEKIGFQRSSKTKTKKDGLGWYLTIPFRHATPQAIADSGIFSSIMPQDVYDIAKNATKPLRKVDLPANQQIPGSRKEINIPGLQVPEYIHKSAKYEGLVRVDVSSSEAEKRGQYMTFRRVSDKSDPNSWFNGGIEAKRLMDRALEQAEIGTVTDMAIDDILEQIMKDRS
jgi:hypothetical protein